MCCLAGKNGHFQSQIVVSQTPSLFFVPPNDPSMLVLLPASATEVINVVI